MVKNLFSFHGKQLISLRFNAEINSFYVKAAGRNESDQYFFRLAIERQVVIVVRVLFFPDLLLQGAQFMNDLAGTVMNDFVQLRHGIHIRPQQIRSPLRKIGNFFLGGLKLLLADRAQVQRLAEAFLEMRLDVLDQAELFFPVNLLVHQALDGLFAEFFDPGKIVGDIPDDMAQLFGQIAPKLVLGGEGSFPVFDHDEHPLDSQGLFTFFVEPGDFILRRFDERSRFFKIQHREGVHMELVLLNDQFERCVGDAGMSEHGVQHSVRHTRTGRPGFESGKSGKKLPIGPQVVALQLLGACPFAFEKTLQFFKRRLELFVRFEPQSEYVGFVHHREKEKSLRVPVFLFCRFALYRVMNNTESSGKKQLSERSVSFYKKGFFCYTLDAYGKRPAARTRWRMIKVLVARSLKRFFMKQNSFLDRADIEVFTAATSGEVMKIHRQEHVDLIITRLDMPSMRSEELFRIIRSSPELRDVSTILVCEDTLVQRERCKQCKVNAFFTMPVDPAQLHLQVQQFLNVAPRMSYRAALAVAISGKFKNQPMPFKTENISANGMLIRAQEPLAKGDGIFFSFFLPDGAHVSGYGEIIRVVRQETTPESFLYGVKYTNIDPEVRFAIDEIAKKQ